MPIYEYACDECGERYERIVMKQRTEIRCPKCASSKQTIQLSVFAAPGNGAKASAETASSGPAAGCGCTPRTCGCH